MRYVPPWGTTDPNAPYVNGDPTIGRQGSIPPAAMMEHPQREIVALIEKSGFTPSETNLQQLAEATRSQRINYAIDTGSQNNLVVAFDPPLTEYTQGLTLRVRVRQTNNDRCSINAGAGARSIRKMNGAEVGDGELPAGCIATLVFDGAVFQLSNFGGGAGGDNVFIGVNVPYTEDLSTEPGRIIAKFTPPITSLVAGNIVAVRVANTAPGATRMEIDDLQPINLLPNGGGIMLQGDIAAGDVVQFFYDGAALRFPPNAEINASVTYTVGPGQQFTSFDNAMQAIRRKTIGAEGYVTLQLAIGVFAGPLNISHPSGDRLCVRGTMRSSAPLRGDFAISGSSPEQRDQDARSNLDMLRTRYGTEITMPDRPPGLEFQAGQRWNGVANLGAGQPLVADLLIVGERRPNDVPSGWDQNGVACGRGGALMARNVAVWGSQMGFSNSGGLYCEWCYACANTLTGFQDAGASGWYRRCGAFGNSSSGYFAEFSSVWADHSTAEANGAAGWGSQNNTGVQMYWCRSTSNGGGFDMTAHFGSNMIAVIPANIGPTNPPFNTIDNLNSLIAAVTATDPGPPIGSPMPSLPPGVPHASHYSTI